MDEKEEFPFEDHEKYSRPVSEEELNVLLIESGMKKKSFNSIVLGVMGEGRGTYLKGR